MTVEQSVANEAPAQSPARKHKKNIDLAAKGSSIIVSGRLFAYGARFVIAYLLARSLGAESFGLYKLAISAAAIVAGLAALGLDSALVRYVAILRRKGDDEGLWGALQLGVGVSALLSVLLAVALFALAYQVADIAFGEPDLAPLLQFLAIFVPFMTLSSVLSGATRGFKKMEYSVFSTNVALLLIRLILIGVLFFSGLDALQAVIIFGLGNLAITFLLLFFVNKEFSLKRPLRSARHDKREILSFSIPLWISGLLKTFRSNIQILLLGSLATVSSVGIFAIVSQLNMLGRMSLNSMTISSKPIIAELHSRGEYDQIGVLYRTTSRWALTLNLPVLIVMVVFSKEILGIFGQEYIGGATALIILAFAELVNVSTGICGSIIDMTGHTRFKLFNSIAQVTVVIGLNLLLIPRYDLLGVAIATMLGIATANLLRFGEVYYLFRLHPYDRTFLKPIMAAIFAFGVALILRQATAGRSNILILAIMALIIAGVYGAILLLLRLPDEEREILGRWLGRARKKLPGRFAG
jgi:O-antigen/teichoic acid export membrane protein